MPWPTLALTQYLALLGLDFRVLPPCLGGALLPHPSSTSLFPDHKSPTLKPGVARGPIALQRLPAFSLNRFSHFSHTQILGLRCCSSSSLPLITTTTTTTLRPLVKLLPSPFLSLHHPSHPTSAFFLLLLQSTCFSLPTSTSSPSRKQLLHSLVHSTPVWTRLLTFSAHSRPSDLISTTTEPSTDAVQRHIKTHPASLETPLLISSLPFCSFVVGP